MYPNAQDVLPFPPRPDLAYYRRLAKALVKACKAGDAAIHEWAVRWIDAEHLARQLADYARDRLKPAECALSQAQFVIARAHGFESWPKFIHHLGDIASESPGRPAFERAADAIVAGDLATLERLLAEQPTLPTARSAREHGATLLHYASANGVENFRQKTPPNIVAIARCLLDAGAAVDAEADVYGGGATTLGLVVTSAHPRQAGVQLALADVLLEHGARMDADIVRSCLANGCPEAAAYMADRGAPVGFVDAAGIGHIEALAAHFAPPRAVSPEDAAAALIMATWYDRAEVVAFLLVQGVDVVARERDNGQTALHVAAYQGNPGLVELLLQRGAPVDVTDTVYSTSPFVWAMHAWLVERRTNHAAYHAVLRLLANAGAEVKPEWLEDERVRAALLAP